MKSNLLILVAATALLAACSNPTDAPEPSPWETDAPVGTQVGFQAPVFTLRDTSNAEVSLKQFRGRIVLLDFWASWC